MSLQSKQILKTTLPSKGNVELQAPQQVLYDRGYLYNFFNIISNNIENFSKTLFGDYSYIRKNKFSVKHKRKVLEYLQAKYLSSHSKLEQQKQKIYVRYNPNYFQTIPQDVRLLKEMVLQGKTQVQAAEQGLQKLKVSKQYIKANFLNQAAFQFDRQRYCSIVWGFITASIINTTLYKRGSFFRKGAVFVTLGHIFGQVGYHINLDKYFDSVYSIFEQQAIKFNKEEQKRQQKLDKTFTPTIVQD